MNRIATTALLAFASVVLAAGAASFQTIGGDAITGDTLVVTNVNFDGVTAIEVDPYSGITNGTIYIHGTNITPLVEHQTLEPATNFAMAVGSAVMDELAATSRVLVAQIESHAPGDYATVSNRAMTALQEHQSLAFTNDYRRTDAKIKWTDVTNREDVATKEYADQYAEQAPDYATVSNKAMTAVQSLDGYATVVRAGEIATNTVTDKVAAWAMKGQPNPEPGNYGNVSNAAMSAKATLDAKASVWDAKQDAITDYTTTNAAAQIVTNNVATWAMAGKAEPVTDLSSRTTFAQATNIAASAAVTNAGVVAYVDAQGYLTVESDPSVNATNPVFSNAVLSVTTGIDTNFVAVIGEFKEAWGDFPLDAGQTTASVGTLLLALAAAIAWLKKNKRDRTDNTCHQTTSGFTLWRATLPSGYSFGDDQPTFDSTTSKWTWYVEGSSVAVDAESGTSTANATSATFTFNDSGTVTFDAVRSSQPATADETFVTADYADKKVGSFSAVGGVTPTVTSGVANLSSLFSSVDTSTDPAASGLLSNTALDKGIVKVVNSIVATPNATLETALGTAS